MGIWVIQNSLHPQFYWSNSLGWVEDGEQIDIFSTAEKEYVNLPISGLWYELGKEPPGP